MARMCLRWILLASLSGWFSVAFGADKPILTDAQRQWLAEHPQLRIGFTDIPPQVFRDSDTGKLAGLCIDYLDTVETKIGYRFERRYYDTWKAMMDAAEANQIDVVYAAQHTPLREIKYVFSTPYLTFQNIILTTHNIKGPITIESLHGKKVAVVSGNSIQEDLRRQHPNIILTPVEDELTGLLKLSFYEVDAMIIEPSRASWIIEDKKITNLHVAGTTEMVFHLGYMVNKEVCCLKDILDAAIAAIPKDTTQAIVTKWIHPPSSFNWRSLLWTLIALGGLIGSVALWNLSLHNQIAVRTRQLSDELTRRRKAEQQRNAAERQFQQIIESAPIGIHTWRLEPDGRLILTGSNTAAEKILKIDHRPLIGQDINAAFPRHIGTEIPDIYKQVCTVGIPYSDMQYANSNNQTAGVYEVYAFQTAPGQMAAMFTEVSERIASQKALRESENLLRESQIIAGLGSYVLDIPAGLWKSSVVLDKVFGIDDAYERTVDGWVNLIHPDDRTMMNDYFRNEVLGQCKAFNKEYRIIRHNDRVERWVHGLGKLEFDAGGIPVKMLGTIRDVTERKHAEQALQFFQFAVEHSGESAYWMDSSARLVYVNKAACQELGYTREELLQLSVPDVDPDFPMDQWTAHWQELREKKTLRFESHHKAKDGTITPIEVSANYVKFEGNEYNCAFVREISERKQFERAIDAFVQTVSSHVGQDMFRDFAEQLAVQLSADMVIVGQLSPGAADLNAIQTLAVFKDGAAVDNFTYPFAGTPCEKTLAEKESIYLIKDHVAEQYPQDVFLAEQHFRSYLGIPLRDINARCLGHICMLFRKSLTNTTTIERILKIFANQAVMELQRMESGQALEHSEYRFREMFARMSSAVAVYQAVYDGQDFIFTDFSPAAERTEKIKKEHLIGRRVTEVFPGIKEFGLLEVFQDVWKTGIPAHHPIQLYKDNRIASWRENYIYKLPTGEIVALYDDVTERIVAEQAREQLLKEIQSKNTELESIVFVASHDLRSPLINIQGFAGELGKSCRDLTVLLGRETLSNVSSIRRILDEDIPESLGFISAGTSKMDALVRGLLQIARIGTTQLHIDRVDMNQLLANILKTIQYQMREYEIDVRIGELPPCLGDWAQLSQVFSNLIDNAIKYRHPGRKAVIEIAGQLQNKHAIYMIRDNGIGIEPEHCEKIFEIFHRLNPAGPIKGEGLGLTIVRRTLDRMNGKITVESEADQGATFTVNLPAAE